MNLITYINLGKKELGFQPGYFATKIFKGYNLLCIFIPARSCRYLDTERNQCNYNAQ